MRPPSCRLDRWPARSNSSGSVRQPLGVTRVNRVHRPDDALAIISIAALKPPRHETFVLLLDDLHEGSDIVCVTGAAWANQVSYIMESIVQAGENSWLGGLVFASVRPSWQLHPNTEDLETWFDMRCRTDALGIDLLDWFLVVDDETVSLAEYTNSTSLWLG